MNDESHESTRKHSAAMKLRGVYVVVAVLLYAWFAIWLPWRGMHCNDFKHIYLGMKALVDGDEPYSPESLFHQASLNGMRGVALNPYVYLPFTGLAMAFLAPLNFVQAATVWFVLNQVFAITSCWIIAQSLFRENRQRAFVVLLLALGLSYPMLRTLTAGQLNLVLLLCLCGAFALLRAGRAGSAGAVLGFAACFKIAPAIFLLYFALRRQWRALGAMVATCAVLMLVSIVAVGWRIHRAFLPVLRQMRYGHSTWEDLLHPPTFWKDPTNQSFNSLFTHLFVGDATIHPWLHLNQQAANAMTVCASVVLFGCYIWFGRGAWRRGEQSTADALELQGRNFTSADEASYHATLMLGLLLPSLMWDHYLLLALLPAAWLIYWCGAHKRWGMSRLAAACYVLIFIPWAHESSLFFHGPLLVLMSMKLFPTVILFLLCCRAVALADPAPMKPQG